MDIREVKHTLTPLRKLGRFLCVYDLHNVRKTQRVICDRHRAKCYVEPLEHGIELFHRRCVGQRQAAVPPRGRFVGRPARVVISMEAIYGKSAKWNKDVNTTNATRSTPMAHLVKKKNDRTTALLSPVSVRLQA